LRAALGILAIVAGGAFLIMFLFTATGLNRITPPWLLVVTDPVILSLIVCWPLWRWVVQPLCRQVSSIEQDLSLLARAMNQLGEGVIITTRRGRIEYVNAAFCRMVGADKRQVIGRYIEEFEPRIAGREWRRSFFDCVVRKRKTWREELCEVRKDGNGDPGVTEYTTAPVRKDGRITHFVSIKRDITVQRALEQQLQHAQKMEVVGTLAGGIAHNFNNMLACLSGNTYLLRRMLDNGASPDDMLGKITAMEQVIFQAVEHIRSLLSFARKGHMDARPTPLSPLIAETLKLARDSVPENIRVHADITTESTTVRVDPTQLQQALLNLLNNAVDALDRTEAPEILICLEHIQHHGRTHACLRVADNGAGMPPHVARKACDPYFTTKAPGKGTGLGLAMAKGLAEQSGGFLSIRSGVNQGCEVRICLPLAPDDHQSTEITLPIETVSGQGKNILLADDEDAVRESMAEALRSMGYNVIEAQNGKQALHHFVNRRGGIHVVILDMIMPEMGGARAAPRMREVSPDTPIILMTGYDINGQVESAVNEGICDTIIAKPVSPELLARHIQLLLDEPS